MNSIRTKPKLGQVVNPHYSLMSMGTLKRQDLDDKILSEMLHISTQKTIKDETTIPLSFSREELLNHCNSRRCVSEISITTQK